MSQLTVNVRMDEKLKKQVEEIFAQMGMNMSTAFNIFARAVVQRREIPFTISAEDHFYSKENQDELMRIVRDEKIVAVKTIEELEAMENE